MAKKSSREKKGLVCTVCNKQNYVTERNKLNTAEPLKIKKYCNKCKGHKEHKEKKKLH